jgi:predicted membrane protein
MVLRVSDLVADLACASEGPSRDRAMALLLALVRQVFGHRCRVYAFDCGITALDLAGLDIMTSGKVS